MDDLVPNLDFYFKHEMNILLISLHGVGKSQSLKEFVHKNNINMKYFSCATLDPYTDFVGIPTPRKRCKAGHFNHPDEVKCQICSQILDKETLRMIRPDSIDDAELIVFDEMNRPESPKMLNAILELVQFRTINGERLPNLKAVWAAVNPPNGDYKVDDLDPALLDRFHAYLEIQPRVSYQYLQERCNISEHEAMALMRWWQTIDYQERGIDNFISPRRMEMVGHMLATKKDLDCIDVVFPKWQEVDRQKLIKMLEKSREIEHKSGTLGDGPSTKFIYNFADLSKAKDLVNYLIKNPQDMETHRAVLEAINLTQIIEESRKKSFDFWAGVLDSINPALLEGVVDKDFEQMMQIKEKISAKGIIAPNLIRVIDHE